MLATNVDRSVPAQAADQGGLAGWLRRHVAPGRIAVFGQPFVDGLDPDKYRIIEKRGLESQHTAGDVFDHAWVNQVLSTGGDPVTAAWRLFHLVRPGGTVLVTVPFGLTGNPAKTRALYPGSLRRLVEPLFEIVDLLVLDDQIAVVGRRRDEAKGVPTIFLDGDERAFYNHDRRINEKLAQMAAELVQSGNRYRGMEARAAHLQAELARRTKELNDLRQKIAKLRKWLRIPLAILRRLRRLKNAIARRLGRPVPAAAARTTSSAIAASPATAGESGGSLREAIGMLVGQDPSWRDKLRSRFTDWLAAARQAPGSEVVLMFSGTTFVQEHRANRPIRLTNVYLQRQCPVFFNYYRSNQREPLPEHPDKLLFQSPIDATQSFLDDVLTADFGAKKKILFVSFPHEMMVRYMMLAAQHGWVTVYDARDDWEEFAKVGMAKWYVPAYERYVAKFADVVTAVSRPLARKMELISGREVHVSPNALDTRFPRPSGPRNPSKPPVIGYFGHLTDKWFDWPLLIETAERYPTYRFELAGHQYPNDLQLPPNVELLGLVGHAELAERSRTWSVALIPFKNGPLADAVDPIKVYEYLHLRLPVLATYFPQCRDYPGTTITEGREEFIERLGQLVGTEVRDEEVSDWLARNTWEQRVDQYTALADAVRSRGRGKLETLVGGAL